MLERDGPRLRSSRENPFDEDDTEYFNVSRSPAENSSAHVKLEVRLDVRAYGREAASTRRFAQP